MYCRKCGTECKDSAKFCSKCGAPLQTDASKNDEALSTPESTDDAAAGTGGWFQRNKKIAWIILIVIIAAVVVIISVSVARHYSKAKDMSPKEHLELGSRYLKAGDYAEAVEELTAILDVEQNMQAYTYLAEAYLDLSDTEDTGEVQVEFHDKVYEGTAQEVYVDVAGEVYEEAVAYALDTYEQIKELPDYTEEMYGDLVDYESSTGRSVSGSTDLGEIITPPISEEDLLSNEDNDNTQDENAPSLEDTEELLNRIRYNCAEDLYSFYNFGDDYASKYSEIDEGEAFSWVGYSLDEPDEMTWSDSEEVKWYVDGSFYQEDELNSDQKFRAEYCYAFPMAYYEESLADMFGYELDDYNLKDISFILQDRDGNYYIAGDYFRGDAFPFQNVTLSIEYISEEPDQDGDYTVIAKYEGDNIALGADQSSNETYFMQFRLRPDQDSKYGYVIAGMTPAGDGELDEEYRSLVEEDESNEKSYMEWQQLYADYIEQIYLEEDTTAESAYAENPEEWLEDYYYYLIYLNDDDLPELLRCSPPDPYRANTTEHIMYIQDSQVKDQEIANVQFAERGGYISGGYGTGAYMEYSVWRLNEQNELVTELEEYEDSSEILINGQDVSQEEFDRAEQEGTAWRTGGNYMILYVGNGTLNLWDTDEEYATPFATGASEAIEALRGGYVEPV